MKTLSTVFAALGVAAGFAAGFYSFIYGIWNVILLCKGTLAVTFWSVAKSVICIFGAGIIGWLVFGLFALIALLLSQIGRD